MGLCWRRKRVKATGVKQDAKTGSGQRRRGWSPKGQKVMFLVLNGLDFVC